MTSLGTNDAAVRPNIVKDGEVTITVAEGPDDPAATPMAQDIMKKILGMTAGKRLLKRRDFKPTDFVKYLGNILIIDVLYDADGIPEDGLIRLMGGSLVSYYGEYTGQRVTAHPSKASGRLILAMQKAVATSQSIILRATRSRQDRPFYHVNSLVVPVVDNMGCIAQVFVHMQPYTRNGLPHTGH